MKKLWSLLSTIALCLVLALSLFALAACNNQGEHGGGEQVCTHSYGDWTTTTEPTCTKTGEKSRSCTLCGNTQTQQIAKTPHSYKNYVCTSCGDEITPSEGLAFSLNADGESYSVSGIGTCTDTKIVIPETYNSKPISSIGEEAFRNCDGLTSVTIPDSVTSIGRFAFCYCSGLTSVTIPDSVTSIDDWAFWSCSGLTSVAILDSVTSIGEGAFYACSGLTSVTIPDSVTFIGEGALEDCSGLTSVTIGNGVTSIARSAFSGCSGLTSVTIPDSVTSIDDWAFWSCSKLENIYITDVAAWCNISNLYGIMYVGSSNKNGMVS